MNLFELFVKIGVDDQASDKISSLSSKLSNGLKTAAKIGTAAVGAAATGIVALTKAAVNNYAEYEQLVGGVETLFKTSSDKVMGYAENAYKTAGLSANEYMETVTSFSASLLQSLDGDTAAAAEKANLAITDMADNANKMGTSMESIQNAYQGFAKQNYTMLDNLKLGYGGTKEEMERLIKDAAKLSDTVDAQSMSFDNIAEAIHVVQTEMGITGTTAEEAASTIQGSVGMMKSSWANLVTGIADENANLDVLITNFVDSVGTVAENIVPKIETALNGAVKLVSDLFPKLAEELPGMIESLLPSVMTGITNILASVIENLPQIIDSIMDMLPGLIDTLVDAIVELAPELAEGIVEIIQSLADHLPEIIQAFIDALPLITEAVNNAIIENFPALLEGIIQIVLLIVKNLPAIIQALVDQIDEIVATIVQVLVENAPALIEGVVMIIWELIKALPEILKSVGESVLNIFKGIGKGLSDAWPAFKEGIVNVWNKFKDWFGKKWEEMKGLGKRIVDGLLQGLKDAWGKLKKWFSDAWNGLVGGVKDFLGIHSPSRLFAGIGKNMALGVGEGWGDEFGNIRKEIDKSLAFDDAAINISASTENISSKQISPSSAGTSIGNVTINIDGAKYENEQSLASAIAEVLQNMTDRRSAIYA